MSFIQNLFSSRENNTDSNTYVGQEGRLFYNSATNAFYIGDGTTVGGKPVSTTAAAITRSNNAVLIDSQTPIIITDMTATPPAGSYLVNFNSQFVVDDTSSLTSQAKADLIALYDAIVALPDPITSHAVIYGNGETLSPGNYVLAGAISIAGQLRLDADGDPDAVFVFRSSAGAFSTAASAEVILINGATSNNVWFASAGASSTGANTVLKGSMITEVAVSTGADTQIEGRMLAINGAAGVGATSILTAPTGTSVLTLGLLSLFNIFCGTGGISNTGASEIQLSIGTNDGAITGFDTATVSGSIIPGGSPTLTVFRVGVYIDGVIIPDSLRSTSRPFEAETFEFPIVLQTVATVTAGQTIDVRAYSELGIQTVGPRMSLVYTPILV
jgi:hypothetical protein